MKANILFKKLNFALLLLNTTLLIFAAMADGSLDVTFNPTGTPAGIVRNADLSAAQCVVIQPDGKILASLGRFGLLYIARYNPDASLDTSFGSGGIVNISVPGSITVSAFVYVVLQSDGKIVVGGTTFIVGGNEFVLARVNSDGSLDSSFGTGGISTSVFSSNGQLLSLALQSDGKIVAGGRGGSPTSFTVSRYNSDGTLDSSFGNSGVVQTIFPNSSVSEINSIAVQPDGKIVAGGYVFITPGNFQCWALARYNTNGSLDSSFGSAGLVVTDINSAAGPEIKSIALQSDGKIVAVGFYGSDNSVLARYTTYGALDTSFALNGIAFIGNSDIYSVALQSDGKIVFSGKRSLKILLGRYLSTGFPDSTFGSSGLVVTTFGSNAGIYDLAIQSDGKIVGAGLGNGFLIARYLAESTLILSPLAQALQAKYCAA